MARNTGLDMASGTHILFLDSDDYIEPNTVSLCMEKMRTHQADIILFSASSFCDGVTAETAKSFNYERPQAFQNSSTSAIDFFKKSIELKNYVVSPCLYIYKRKNLENIKFHPNIVHEDNLFTTRLLLENSNIQITCIPDKLFNRRIRPESTMTQTKQERHINGYITVAEELIKLKKRLENSEVEKPLSQFIQNVSTSALISCCTVYNNKFPHHIRKRTIQIFKKINIKHLNPKNLAICMIPELLIITRKIKKAIK
ncbi:hypothetical protein D9M70_379520 [compost metagenome]